MDNPVFQRGSDFVSGGSVPGQQSTSSAPQNVANTIRMGAAAMGYRPPTSNQPAYTFSLPRQPTHSYQPYQPIQSAPQAGGSTSEVLQAMMLQQQQQTAMANQQHQALLETLKVIAAGQQIAQNSVPRPDMPFGNMAGPPAADPSGWARIDPILNEPNAQILGIHPGAVRRFEGDVSTVDMTKMKKQLTSGENRYGNAGVLWEHRWPHHLLSTIAVPNPPGKHADLTERQFFSGFVNKILVEMPLIEGVQETENKLRFLAHIVNLSHNTAWPHVLEVAAGFFRALEQMQQSWASWTNIEIWLERAGRNIRSLPAPRPSDHGRRQNPFGQGDHPTKKPRNEFVEGIPTAYIKENKLCIMFNLGRCNESGNHALKNSDGKLTVSHLCAGCFKAGRGSQSNHGASNCSFKPFGNLF